MIAKEFNRLLQFVRNDKKRYSPSTCEIKFLIMVCNILLINFVTFHLISETNSKEKLKNEIGNSRIPKKIKL